MRAHARMRRRASLNKTLELLPAALILLVYASSRFFKAPSVAAPNIVTTQAAEAATATVAPVKDNQQCPPKWNRAPGKVVLMHVPRTLGSLVTSGLEQHLPREGPQRWCHPSDDSAAGAIYSLCPLTSKDSRQALLSAMQRTFPANCAGFGTHWDFSLLSALNINFENVLTIATLREPVDRVISHYYFIILRLNITLNNDLNVFLPTDYNSASPYDTPSLHTNFDGLLRFASVTRLFANLMTYAYGGAMGCTPEGVEPRTLPEAQVLERAKLNLARFCMIAIKERADESMAALREFTGWTEDGGYLNTKTQANAVKYPKVPDDVRERIRLANQLDVQLYEYGVQLFEQRRKQSS